MSLSRGQSWGGTGDLPYGSEVAGSDAELRAVVTSARAAGDDPPTVGLTGGDLWRTLGGRSRTRGFSDESTRVVVDIGSVLLDGRIHWFVAHLVARRSWLIGRCWIAANASHLGRWNLAPRAHPGDGLLDLLDSNLPIRQRLQAHRRLRAGNHVPHPGIAYTRQPAQQISFQDPVPIHLDSESVGSYRNISVRLDPAALHLVL